MNTAMRGQLCVRRRQRQRRARALSFLLAFVLLSLLAVLTPAQAAAPAVAAGCTGNSSYTLDTAGILHAWGDNAFGQLGSGSLARTSGPVVVPLPPEASAWTLVVPGERHCLALADGGALYAWGDNRSGQLGLGTTTPMESRLPVKVPSPADVTAWRFLACGSFHCLAVSDSGRLYAWGDNYAGQLGLGSTNFVSRPTPVEFPPGVTSWIAIAGGGVHSLAVADTTLLYTWGGNGWGQVGVTPIGGNVLTPTQVTSGRWQSVAAGKFFSLALDYVGRLAYWGRSDQFNHIDGPLLTGPSIWSRMVAGGEHYLAIKNDGTLYGGGSNDRGQSGFGDAHAAGVIFPQAIPSYERALNPFAIAAGGWHSLVLGTDCSLSAFGTNSHGQLGLPQAIAILPTPVNVVTQCVETSPYHPEVSLSVSTNSLSEYQAGTQSLPRSHISRNGELSIPLAVALTISGTAGNGVDYRELPESVTIPAGAAETTLTIRPLDDRLVEGDETIEFRVSEPDCLINRAARLDCYTPGPNKQVVVRLEDAEAGPFALPQLTWVQPHDGSVFLAPATVPLHMDYHDDNGWIIQLLLLANDQTSTSVSIIKEFPTPGETNSYTWFFRSLGPGFYSWKVVALDDQGDTNSSSALNVVVVSSNDSPRLSLLSPANPDGIQLGIQGESGRNFFIQDSSNLVSWHVVWTDRLRAPSAVIPLGNQNGHTQAFFRAFYGP